MSYKHNYGYSPFVWLLVTVFFLVVVSPGAIFLLGAVPHRDPSLTLQQNYWANMVRMAPAMGLTLLLYMPTIAYFIFHRWHE